MKLTELGFLILLESRPSDHLLEQLCILLLREKLKRHRLEEWINSQGELVVESCEFGK